MRIASNREEALRLIEDLKIQNESPDLGEEQIEENNVEIEELKKWL